MLSYVRTVPNCIVRWTFNVLVPTKSLIDWICKGNLPCRVKQCHRMNSINYNLLHSALGTIHSFNPVFYYAHSDVKMSTTQVIKIEIEKL